VRALSRARESGGEGATTNLTQRAAIPPNCHSALSGSPPPAACCLPRLQAWLVKKPAAPDPYKMPRANPAAGRRAKDF
jgi:hypothetical protein